MTHAALAQVLCDGDSLAAAQAKWCNARRGGQFGLTTYRDNALWRFLSGWDEPSWIGTAGACAYTGFFSLFLSLGAVERWAVKILYMRMHYRKE
jgi:hypothetical protein